MDETVQDLIKRLESWLQYEEYLPGTEWEFCRGDIEEAIMKLKET